MIEGIPSSGKTTLAKTLANRCQGIYFKSLLLDDGFREATLNSTESDLLHMVDLFRNGCTISKMLAEGKSVMWDKFFLSSLSHFLSRPPVDPAIR